MAIEGVVDINTPDDVSRTALFVSSFLYLSSFLTFHLKKYYKSLMFPLFQAQSTPLHIATSSGHLHIVVLLIQTGFCDVNAINNQDQTPLFYAASKNWIEVLSFYQILKPWPCLSFLSIKFLSIKSIKFIFCQTVCRTFLSNSSSQMTSLRSVRSW